MTNRTFNFGAGPAMLPLEVLEEAQRDLLNWRGTGASIMEISHRSPEFMALAEEIEQDFREVLNVPSHYHILFLSGGGQGQFAMVPMNLLGYQRKANYACTGHWSQLAAIEAKRFGQVQIVTESSENGFNAIAPVADWQIDQEAAYLHYVDNETIHGLEFPSIPDIDSEMPLVADMSSNILSRPVDVSRFGLIYACAQKNMGPSGITVVIVRKDLLGQANPLTPAVFNYQQQAEFHSMRNTPPTFPWYMLGLNLKWIKREGGILEMARRSECKSGKLYAFIDQSKLYENSVCFENRSRINVIFRLKNMSLEQHFLQEAREAGLTYLKGHKVLGGMRASLYNGMPESGVDALIRFMDKFEK